MKSPTEEFWLSGTKALGLILLILSMPLILAGVIYLGSDSTVVPDLFEGDRALSGYVTAGLGVFFLLLGIILMLMKPKQTHVVVQPVAPPPQQQVEIKRTEMNWGTQARAKTASEALQDQLDAVNQKMSRVKVQYGMGELSSESYKTLTQQYEQEKAAIEKQIMDQQHA